MPLITLPSLFDAAELNGALNIMPPEYNEVGGRGMFPFQGITGTVTAVQRNTYGLGLVHSGDWCAPPRSVNSGRQRELIFMDVPHTPIIDTVLPCDITGKLKFDLTTENGLVTMAEEVNERMRQMRSALELTNEYRKTRALFGVVLDADGGVMRDLYQTFGLTPVQFDWAVNAATFDLREACHKLHRLMRKQYHGTYNGVGVMMKSDAFDKLLKNPGVAEIYKRHADLAAQLTGNLTQQKNGYTTASFTYAGVTFWEYAAESSFTDSTGTQNAVDFLAVPAGGGYAAADLVCAVYPMNTNGTFYDLGAAPMTNSSVNTKATQAYHARMRVKDWDEGFELKVESNQMPICQQPQALMRLRIV